MVMLHLENRPDPGATNITWIQKGIYSTYPVPLPRHHPPPSKEKGVRTSMMLSHQDRGLIRSFHCHGYRKGSILDNLLMCQYASAREDLQLVSN